eukprot:gene11182-7759_t
MFLSPFKIYRFDFPFIALSIVKFHCRSQYFFVLLFFLGSQFAFKMNNVPTGEGRTLSVAAPPFEPSPQWQGIGPQTVTHPISNASAIDAENERLSVHAKPWNPKEAFDDSSRSGKAKEIEVSYGIRTIDYMGRKLAAPIFIDFPMKPGCFEETLDTFETVRPTTHPNVELHVYFYPSQIRTAKAYYGKISSRKADVTLRNIPADVPPLCASRIIENIVSNVGKLIAIHFSDTDGYHYDIWLDKAGTAPMVVEKLSNSLWTFPMSHGYAVYFKGDNEKRYAQEYIEKYSSQEFGNSEVLPTLLKKRPVTNCSLELRIKRYFMRLFQEPYPLSSLSSKVGHNLYKSSPPPKKESKEKIQDLEKIFLSYMIGWVLQRLDERFHNAFSFASTSEKVVEAQRCSMQKQYEERGVLFLTSIRFAFSSEKGHLEHVFLEDVAELEHRASLFRDELLVHSTAGEKFRFFDFKSRRIDDFAVLFKTLMDVRKRLKRMSITPSDRETEAFDDDTTSDSISESTEENEKSREFVALEGYRKSLLEADHSEEGLDPSTNNINGDTKYESFIKVFSDIASSQCVTSRYRCTLLNQDNGGGVLYLTQSYLLFSPSTGSTIRVSLLDITDVKKEQFFMVIDGVSVTVRGGQTFYFVNLLSRDNTYDSIKQAISRSQGGAQAIEAATSTPSTFIIDVKKLPVSDTRDGFSQVDTDYGTAFSDYSCFTKSLITPIDFPAGKNLGDVFSVGFDDGSKILGKYHSERDDTEQVMEKWRPTKDGGAFRGQRVFTCMTPVKVFFGKRYPYTEYQRYAFLNISGTPTLMVQFSSQITGVMTGDAFRAEALIVCSQRGSGADCVVRMEAYGYVQFLKNVWVKAKITHNTLDIELPEGYKKIGDMIHESLRLTGSSASAAHSKMEPGGIVYGKSMDSHPQPVYVQEPFLPYVFTPVPENVLAAITALVVDILVMFICLTWVGVYWLKWWGRVFSLKPDHNSGSPLMSSVSTTLTSIVLFLTVQYAFALLNVFFFYFVFLFYSTCLLVGNQFLFVRLITTTNSAAFTDNLCRCPSGSSSWGWSGGGNANKNNILVNNKEPKKNLNRIPVLNVVRKQLTDPETMQTLTTSGDFLNATTATSRDGFSQVDTDYGTAFSDYSCFTKSLITPIDFPAGKNLGDVFSVGFDDGSKILGKYHSERDDTEQVMEKWRPTKDGGAFRGQRVFTCMTPVKVFFGKRYPYTEYQRYAFLNISGTPTLMVQFSSQITGVMTGDAFRAEALIVCSQRGSGADCVVRMEAYGYVQFLKNVWVKAKITHNTLDIELPEGYKKIGDMIHAALLNDNSGEVSGQLSKDKSDEEVHQELKDSSESSNAYIQQTAGRRVVQCRLTILCSIIVILCAVDGFFIEIKRCLGALVSGIRKKEGNSVEEWEQGLTPAASFVFFLIILCFLQIVVKAWNTLHSALKQSSGFLQLCQRHILCPILPLMPLRMQSCSTHSETRSFLLFPYTAESISNGTLRVCVFWYAMGMLLYFKKDAGYYPLLFLISGMVFCCLLYLLALTLVENEKRCWTVIQLEDKGQRDEKVTSPLPFPYFIFERKKILEETTKEHHIHSAITRKKYLLY